MRITNNMINVKDYHSEWLFDPWDHICPKRLFLQVKPSEASKKLHDLANDLLYLVELYCLNDSICKLSEYRLNTLYDILLSKNRYDLAIFT